MPQTQNFQNHGRYFPLVHFVVFPLLTVNLIFQSVRLYQDPGWDRAVFTTVSLVLILMTIAARVQALKAQDRVIRLEEQMRYMRVLPPDLAAEASDFSVGQIVALRFAPDIELPELVRRTRAGEFETNKQIKRAVKTWRGDHHRV